MNKYATIQNEVIEQYKIKICPRETCTCWSRTHAHIKQRTVCKWDQANSFKSTFTLLHEVGHIVTNKAGMRRCEEEYYATQWAADKCLEYGLEVPEDIRIRYQKYINAEMDRGRRRGASFASDYLVKWNKDQEVQKIPVRII